MDVSDIFYAEHNEGTELQRIPTTELLPDMPNVDIFQHIDTYIEPKTEFFNENEIPRTGLALASSVQPESPIPFYNLPTLDEMDSDYEFNVILPQTTSDKGGWIYSPKLNKIFIKIGHVLNVNFTYKNPTKQSLFLRAMLVPTCLENAKDSLVLCPNHRQNQPDLHIMRCTKKNSNYEGNETGYYVNDRLSVVTVLTDMAKNEPLCFEFLCQNSCSGGINRKITSIIFTLEDANRKVLGKRVKHVKICSCPKRDKEKEEAAQAEYGIGMPKKRKPEKSDSTRSNIPKKIMKVKQEPVESPAVSTVPGTSGFEPRRIEIPVGNRQTAILLYEMAYNCIAGQMQNTSNPQDKVHLKNFQDEIIRLKEGINQQP